MPVIIDLARSDPWFRWSMWGTTEVNLGAKVVTSLTKQLTGLYHHVQVYHYYSISRQAFSVVGQWEQERKPKWLTSHCKKRIHRKGGQSKRWQYENLTVSLARHQGRSCCRQWSHHKRVCYKERDGTQINVQAPLSVTLYNKYMGGVDHNDQLRGYYHVRLKCRKYYWYISWFMFEIVVTNLYILCKHHTDLGIQDVKTFRVELAKLLIGDYCSRKRSSCAVPQKTSKFCPAHFPVRGSDKNHRCHYCYLYRKERHETKWFCRDCGYFLRHNWTEEDRFYIYHNMYP